MVNHGGSSATQSCVAFLMTLIHHGRRKMPPELCAWRDACEQIATPFDLQFTRAHL